MKEIIRRFLGRMAAGLMLILALNFVFEQAGIPLSVGLNPVTAVSVGTLGVPGVILLYGITGCRLS